MNIENIDISLVLEDFPLRRYRGDTEKKIRNTENVVISLVLEGFLQRRCQISKIQRREC